MPAGSPARHERPGAVTSTPGGHHDRAESEDRSQRPPDRVQERHEAERRRRSPTPRTARRRASAAPVRSAVRPRRSRPPDRRATAARGQAAPPTRAGGRRSSPPQRRRRSGRPPRAAVPSPPRRTAPSALLRPCARRPRGASSSRSRPTSRIEIAIAALTSRAPSTSTGPESVKPTSRRTCPATCAPSAWIRLPPAMTSPVTWAVSSSRIGPCSAITSPPTCPPIVTGPSSTTTSPCATPSIVALPEKTTTSPTTVPRGTDTSPDSTTWSTGCPPAAPRSGRAPPRARAPRCSRPARHSLVGSRRASYRATCASKLPHCRHGLARRRLELGDRDPPHRRDAGRRGRVRARRHRDRRSAACRRDAGGRLPPHVRCRRRPVRARPARRRRDPRHLLQRTLPDGRRPRRARTARPRCRSADRCRSRCPARWRAGTRCTRPGRVSPGPRPSRRRCRWPETGSPSADRSPAPCAIRRRRSPMTRGSPRSSTPAARPRRSARSSRSPPWPEPCETLADDGPEALYGGDLGAPTPPGCAAAGSPITTRGPRRARGRRARADARGVPRPARERRAAELPGLRAAADPGPPRAAWRSIPTSTAPTPAGSRG